MKKLWSLAFVFALIFSLTTVTVDAEMDSRAKLNNQGKNNNDLFNNDARNDMRNNGGVRGLGNDLRDIGNEANNDLRDIGNDMNNGFRANNINNNPNNFRANAVDNDRGTDWGWLGLLGLTGLLGLRVRSRERT